MIIFGLLEYKRWLKKEGDIVSLLSISKSTRHQVGLLLAEKYHIPKMGVVVLKGNCPTNRGSCPIGLIVLRGRCPKG